MSTLKLDSLTIYEKHEECRQTFIAALADARNQQENGRLVHARFVLMRANAAVAQGLVLAELLGVDPSGWYARINDIMTLWERSQ